MGSVELVSVASVTAYAIVAALLGRADPPQPGLQPTLRGGSAAALKYVVGGGGPGVVVPVPGVTLVAIVALAATDPPVLVRALACGFAGFAINFALHLASAGSIGFGDVKLAGVVGLVAGFHGLVTAWWSFLAGPTPVPDVGGADPDAGCGPGSRSGRGWSPAGPDLTVRRQIFVQATSMSRSDTPASLTARPTSPRAKLVAPYSGHRVKRTVNRAVSPTIRTSSYSGPVSKMFLIDSATATRCSMSACPTTALPVSAAGA